MRLASLRFSHCPDWLFITLLMLFSAAIKLVGISQVSLWIDEAYSFLVANGHPYPEKLSRFPQSVAQVYDAYLAWQPLGWTQLIASLKQNVHLPQYYLLLNPWLGWVGNDAFGLRSFSTLLSTLTLIPFYYLALAIGKRLYTKPDSLKEDVQKKSRRMAIWGSVLMAFVPMQLYYAQEGRMYALSMFWAVTSAFALWHLTAYLQTPSTSPAKKTVLSLAYTLTLLGGLSSHYMFVFYLSFHGLYIALAFLLHRQKRNFWFFLIPVFACVGLAWIWYPVYKIQQAGVWENYHFAKQLMKPMRYICKFPLMPMESFANNNIIARLFYFPLGAAMFWGYLLYRLGYAQKKPETTTPFWQPEFKFSGAFRLYAEGFILCWLFTPIVTQCAYDLLKETHTTVITRYLLLVTPAVPLWGGLVMQSLAEKSAGIYQRLKAPLLAMILLYALASVFKESPAYMHSNKKNFDTAAAYLAKHLRAGDLLFTNGPLGAPNLMVYYLKKTHPTLPVIYWVKDYNGKDTPLPDMQALSAYQRVWFFNNRSNERRGLDVARATIQEIYPNFHSRIDPEGQLDLYTRH
ncbi:MAG: DUF2723 domain-containing protein [Vampirovibrionales bacterium]|nr:DUF2723 domain-containing protein [Vampirovibrionales bacterium]